MHRICLLMCISLLAIMFETGAQAERKYGMAGCGLGAIILGPKGGKFMQLLAGTTNGVSSQFSAISSGSSGCKPDDETAQIMKQEQFVLNNLSTLSKDMAQGEGESLIALSETLGCKATIQQDINETLQADYEEVFAAPGAMAILDQTKHSLLQDPKIAANCQFLIL